MKVSKLAGLFLILFLANVVYGKGSNDSQTAKELPFYFPSGVIVSTDPVTQLQEYLRYMTATEYRFQGGPKGRSRKLITGSDSIVVETDLESTSASANQDNPTKMKLVLDHYVRMPDGKIRVTFLDDQVLISSHQLQVVINDLIQATTQARDNNYAYYKELSEMATNARMKKLGFPEALFRKILDEAVPGYKHGITFRELNRLPRPMRLSDFVPAELHLGYNPPFPGILGVTWLNTGIVYYNPAARIKDYLSSKPATLQHEMVHCNVNLQEVFATQGFDAENMASIPEMFYEENEVDFVFHHYAEDMRELSQSYFGFNFKQAREEIFKYDLVGNLLIDEGKFREYFQKLRSVKKELHDFFRDTVIPEFYSDPTWWSAMHEKLRDKNGVFRIMMAGYYNPTILGGERETMQWLETHENEIKKMAEEAYELSDQSTGPTVQPSSIPQAVETQYNQLINKELREKIRKHFQANPGDLQLLESGEIDRVFKIIRKILASENRGERP